MPRDFNCIAADPPWKELGGCGRGTGSKYPTIKKREDILRVMVTSSVWRPAEVAHLWLWATTTHMKDAFWLMDALGFEYKTFGIWEKVSAQGTLRMGTGQYMRHTFEPILFGVRGRGARKLAPAGHGIPDLLASVEEPVPARRREHSKKPDEWYDRIERVSVNATRRLEMFARDPRPGWTVWGNEVETVEVYGP